MANTQAGNIINSSMPSQGGGQESRQKTPQITIQQMINNPFYFQEEFSVGQDSGPRNDGQEQKVQVKGIEDHGTIYFRAETESGKDMNEVAEEKPWFSIDKAGNIVQAVGDNAPGILKDAGGSFIDAGTDLFKQTTGLGQEKPKPQPKTPEEQKKEEEKIKNRIANVRTQEMFDILNMPKHEVKIVRVGDQTVTLEQAQKARGVNESFTGDVQADGTLTVNAEAEAIKGFADQAKKAAKAAQTPFQIASARIGRKGTSSRLDQMAEGGQLSNTGGGGVG